MKYKFIALIFISISQSQISPLDLARLYSEEKNYNSAILEYKRYLFFNKQSNNSTTALLELYKSYQAIEDWPNAFSTIEKAYLSTNDDSLKDRIYIDKAILLISKGKIQRSEIILTKISKYTNYEKIKRESYYWLGLGHLYSCKWMEAKNIMKKYYGESYNQYLDSIFINSNKLDLKSPQRARLFSLFIPGLGQIYSKDYKNGMNSLILNSLTSYFLFNSIIDKKYLDALIIYYTPFERYYWGSSRNAELIANNYNQKISKQFAESVFNSILKIQD